LKRAAGGELERGAMETSLKETIASACEVTGVIATLLLVPLAATGGLDELDLFAMALVVLPLTPAPAIRGKDESPQEPRPRAEHLTLGCSSDRTRRRSPPAPAAPRRRAGPARPGTTRGRPPWRPVPGSWRHRPGPARRRRGHFP